MSISSLPMPTLPYPPNTSNPYEKIRGGNNQIARMQFPTDMGRYYIAFEFAPYSYKYNSGTGMLASAGANAINAGLSSLGINFSVDASRNARAQYGIGSVNAQIALPLPPNLVDDQQLEYNTQNLLNVAGAGAQAVFNEIVKKSQYSSQINTAETVAGSLGKFASLYTGYTVNPFLAMMFTGPRFKTHQFGWRFSPNNEAETDQLVRIINTFKAKSLPAIAGGIGFAYPEVCMISIYPESARNRMFRFKPAVIQEVSVHYAPTGTPSFFAGSNGPTEIEFKLQLSEISIWTHDDLPDYTQTQGGGSR